MFIWGSDVVSVATETIANYFSINSSASGFCVFPFLYYVCEDRRHAEAGMLLTSSTIMPAPSPMTNPSRDLSNGRDAADGLSLKFDERDRALHWHT